MAPINIQPEGASRDCLLLRVRPSGDGFSLDIEVDAFNRVTWHTPRLLPWMRDGASVKLILAAPSVEAGALSQSSGEPPSPAASDPHAGSTGKPGPRA